MHTYTSAFSVYKQKSNTMDAFGNIRENLERIVNENIFEGGADVSRSASIPLPVSENSSRTTNASNNETQRPTNSDQFPGGDDGGIGILGWAGIAIAAYTAGKLLFGSRDPPKSGNRRMYEDEEEVPERRAPKHPKDFFNASYLARISKQIKK
jgi:hypothetical protein